MNTTELRRHLINLHRHTHMNADIVERAIEACALCAEAYISAFNKLGDQGHKSAYESAKTIQLVVDAIRKLKSEPFE